MRRIFLSGLALLTALAVGGCDTESLDSHTTETEEARKQWADQDEDYSFVLQRGCFCPNAGTFWIQVVDGEITIVQRVQDHEYLPAEQFSDFPTVDDLFDLIDRAIRESADDIRYEFDADGGYPLSIMIDWIQPAVDDEISYQVRSAVPGVTLPD